MSSIDYSREAKKLIDFAQRCVESCSRNDESLKRMQVEIKNKRESRKNLESMNLLEEGRYDLLDDEIIEKHVTDYPRLVKAFANADPSSCEIEYKPSRIGFHKRRDSRDRTPNAKKVQRADKKKQQLMENAEQNSSLVKTLLGSPYYIDLTHSPPPPLPPPLPQGIQPINTYGLPPQLDFAGSSSYQDSPVMSYGSAPTHSYPVPAYQPQPFQVSEDIVSLPPSPHITSTLPLPGKLQSEQNETQAPNSRRKSRKPTRQKQLPKSLRKMDKIAKRYDLDT